MRNAGLPCRFGGCGIVIAIADQHSLPALLAGSARRNEHEIAAHGYHHIALEGSIPRTWQPIRRDDGKGH